MKKVYLLFVILLVIISSCGEDSSPEDSIRFDGGFRPADETETTMVSVAIGYAGSLGITVKEVISHKVVNLKNGDRFYYVEMKKEPSGIFSFAYQFSGVYNSNPVTEENVVLFSCENTGNCDNCSMALQGNCGVMSCSCIKDGPGIYDCELSLVEMENFATNYSSEGKKLAAKIKIPKLEQVFCESY